MTKSFGSATTPDYPVEVSVVIVNWNTEDLLRGCLRSIREQTNLPHEVIVVDNASRDGSAAMVRAEFPETILIANTENKGFAAANNQGLRIARGSSVLLLNPDTLVLDHAIDTMQGWLDRHPQVGCVGCQVLEGPDVIQRTCFADPTFLNSLIIEFGLMRLGHVVPFFGRPWYVTWDRKSEREVDVVSGMFMLVPKAVVDKVGLLDEEFFVYSEEADWCRRIRDAGYTCVFAPEAQIIHLDGGSKSTSQIRSRMFIQMHKSHLIYTRKHGGALGYWGARMIYLGTSTLRFGLFSLLRLVKSDENMKARVRLSRAAIAYHLLGREPV
ncbi:MAG: glycosyltransferase family 2 protein [Tabrizicola sp.]|nr:glycosyltransferase family 2 protein [Tabrizicola sp.]